MVVLKERPKLTLNGYIYTICQIEKIELGDDYRNYFCFRFCLLLMDTYESQSNHLAGELAAKVSRLKHVSDYCMRYFSFVYHCFDLFKIAFDIETESKEHNRFLQSMVKFFV